LVGGPVALARSLTPLETLLPPIQISVFLGVLELLAGILMCAAWSPVSSPSLGGTAATRTSRLGVTLCLLW
jgi:hypothetical protein